MSRRRSWISIIMGLCIKKEQSKMGSVLDEECLSHVAVRAHDTWVNDEGICFYLDLKCPRVALLHGEKTEAVGQ